MSCSCIGNRTIMTTTRMKKFNVSLLALVSLLFLFSYPSTFAGSSQDSSLNFQQNEPEKDDHHRPDTTDGNECPKNPMSVLSSETSMTSEETRNIISSSATVRSNQHGLISVSILVEEKERKTMPIAVPPGQNLTCYDIKEREVPLISDFEKHSPGDFSLHNSVDTIWTVLVESIHVGTNTDDSKLISTPYSQRIVLDWKKTQEVDEYVMESSHDVVSNSGCIDTDGVVSSLMVQNLIHRSGSANCTFMIPLQGYDSSSSPSLISSSTSSKTSLSSFGTTTFIVSLIQSRRMASSLTNSVLNEYTRNKNHRDNLHTTTTVLTRRLATLPRKANPGHQSTINPIAKVFLHHSQLQTLHEAPQLPTYSLSEDGDSRRESKNFDDDKHFNQENSDSRNKHGSFDRDTNFLWTFLSLSIIHIMRWQPVGCISTRAFWRHVKSAACTIQYYKRQRREWEGNYEDNPNCDHCHGGEEGENEDNKVDINENFHQEGERCYQRLDQIEGRKNRSSSIRWPIPYFQTSRSHSETKANRKFEESFSSLTKALPRNHCDKDCDDKSSGSVSFSYSDSNDCDQNIGNVEIKEGERYFNTLDHSIYSLPISNDEAPLGDATMELETNTEFLAYNNNIHERTDSSLKTSNTKDENMRVSLGLPDVLFNPSITGDPKKLANNMEVTVASEMVSPSQNNIVSNDTSNDPKNSTKVRKIKETNTDSPFKESVRFKIRKNDRRGSSSKQLLCGGYSDACPSLKSKGDQLNIFLPENIADDVMHESSNIDVKAIDTTGSMKGSEYLETFDGTTNPLIQHAVSLRPDDVLLDRIPPNKCSLTILRTGYAAQNSRRFTEYRKDREPEFDPKKRICKILHPTKQDHDSKATLNDEVSVQEKSPPLFSKEVIESIETAQLGQTHKKVHFDLSRKDAISKDKIQNSNVESFVLNAPTLGGSKPLEKANGTKHFQKKTSDGSYLSPICKTRTDGVQGRSYKLVQGVIQIKNRPIETLQNIENVLEGCNQPRQETKLPLSEDHFEAIDEDNKRHENFANSRRSTSFILSTRKMRSSGWSVKGPLRTGKGTIATEDFSSKMDSPSSLPPRGQEILTQFSNHEKHNFHLAIFGQSEEDLSKKPEMYSKDSLQDRAENTLNLSQKNVISTEDNFKRSQSFPASTNRESQEKIKIQNDNSQLKKNTSPGFETEESYVSTLPPDSDYLSDDDPLLFLGGGSSLRSQSLVSQSNEKNNQNEQKNSKPPTEGRCRKKRKLRRRIGFPKEKTVAIDPTLPLNNPEIFPNKVSKETNLDSIEIVRVTIPDKFEGRDKRPYSHSNYVADWVPSNELQSMSQDFFKEESWEIVAPILQTSCTTVPESISVLLQKSEENVPHLSATSEQRSRRK